MNQIWLPFTNSSWIFIDCSWIFIMSWISFRRGNPLDGWPGFRLWQCVFPWVFAYLWRWLYAAHRTWTWRSRGVGCKCWQILARYGPCGGCGRCTPREPATFRIASVMFSLPAAALFSGRPWKTRLFRRLYCSSSSISSVRDCCVRSILAIWACSAAVD